MVEGICENRCSTEGACISEASRGDSGAAGRNAVAQNIEIGLSRWPRKLGRICLNDGDFKDSVCGFLRGRRLTVVSTKTAMVSVLFSADIAATSTTAQGVWVAAFDRRRDEPRTLYSAPLGPAFPGNTTAAGAGVHGGCVLSQEHKLGATSKHVFDAGSPLV